MSGVSTSEIPVIRSYSPFEVHFDNVEVPIENRLGEENKGFAICQQWLIHSRLPYSAGVIGIAQAALALAIDWVKERETFKSALADKQAVQWDAGGIRKLSFGRRDCLSIKPRGTGCWAGTSRWMPRWPSYTPPRPRGRVIDRCVQMFGAMGVAKELPLERWYRELRIKRIGEGPSEVQRMVVARDLLKGDRLGH